MKRFELWEYDKETETIEENVFRNFLTALKKTVGRVIQRGVSLFRKARPGQAVRLKFPLPSVISESAQTGKAGGELAEVSLLNELSILLEKHMISLGVSKTEAKERVYFNRGDSRETWYSQTYNAADQVFNSSAKRASDKAEKSKWISHGKAGARLIFNELKNKLGEEDFLVTDFQMDHEGQSEIGKSKKDFSVLLRKHDTNRLRRKLGFSMKATADKSPYETPTQAYQTGYAAIVISLITGKYTKEADDIGGNLNGYSNLIRSLDKIKDPEKRKKQLEKIKNSYESTYLFELDKLGTKLGYGTSTLKGNEIPNMSKRSLLLGQYLDALSRYFKDAKKAKRQSGKSYEENFVVNVNDYMAIIYDVLEQRISNKKTKQDTIQAILKFGGIEKDLYYLAAGVAPGDKEGSAAVTTLFNNDYEKMVKELLNTELDITLEYDTKGTGKNNIVIRIHRKDGTTLIRFTLYKEHQDTRISLPSFSHDGEYEKVDQRVNKKGKLVGGKTVDQSKLLRKYATNKYNMD